MTNQKLPLRRSLLSSVLCLLLLTSLTLTFPSMSYANGPRLREPVRPSFQPCAPDDQSELCRLRRAVSGALDQVASLESKLGAAQEAITALQAQADAAKVALAANQIEREAAQRTIALADSAIKQQQSLMEDYKSMIKDYQELVKLSMARVDKLEDKLDKANGRTAKLGAALTIVSIISAVLLKR